MSMSVPRGTSAEIPQLLESLRRTEIHMETVDPRRRSLRFSVMNGQGWIQGDEVRTRLCADLYNARETIAEALQLLADSRRAGMAGYKPG